MKFLIILCFLAIAYGEHADPVKDADQRRPCIPNYVKCKARAQDEKAADQCIWDFVKCIKEDCDTHECDGYAKSCLKAATTRIGKHTCALGWFRCVQKMHQKICHNK